ncbi:hypothetical protein TREMEDRAFT_57223 [Tremella mesenterica DSM 1558]|uniref:uncharacterized protein n=1 Tax=Tremella mesenterica (strain ATCC 24925 / CBS 8224 / DSM 1558 / NBRC 9311 / NRRL Y-6157 / RJB 2259-6 / UBC 559-6) TaxID=578456 RepID=UPI0003F4A49B|nr:uncharacterized protein TREMEDRAFT_57223 [Tremella mesenterica DSM 1558]EIW68800.1 hypothetical protein TREMEDRAFT_57223 [Tremella mesenterica DSM 1558]
MSPVASPSANGRPGKRAHPYSRAVSTGSESPEPELMVGESGDMDQVMRERIARKEARIIRNRQSAQRSRNQRKAHVTYLEDRVKYLEQENQRLRGDSPSLPQSPISTSSSLSPVVPASPARSVVSLTSGITLSDIAPAPKDMDVDVKPVIPVTSSSAQPTQASGLEESTLFKAMREENALWRERVSKLEELVKSLTGLIQLPTPTSAISAEIPASPLVPVDAFDITAFLEPIIPDTGAAMEVTPTHPSGLQTTLSPALSPLEKTSPSLTAITFSNSNVTETTPSSTSTEIDTLARHPAEVATLPPFTGLRRAPQRARIMSTTSRKMVLDLGTEVGRARLDVAARIIVGLAQLRASHQKVACCRSRIRYKGKEWPGRRWMGR